MVRVEQAAGNPASNTLPPGMGAEQIAGAIADSGYPLQGLVAATVRDFVERQGEWSLLDEEWSYVDRFTDQLRAIDVHAAVEIDLNRIPKTRTRPALDLLIECKRTTLPTVFFASGPQRLRHAAFPMVAGLRSSAIEVETDDDPSTWTFPIQTALGLNSTDLIRHEVPMARYLARAEFRTGKAPVLSGQSPYLDSVQPLVAAMEYLRRHAEPLLSFRYLECRAVLALSVIDGPMLVANGPEAGSQFELAPWVRVVRDEARPERHPFQRTERYVIDFVHAEYLREYLDRWVGPFRAMFFERVVKHSAEAYSGVGFVAGLGARHRPMEIEADLRPRRAVARQRGTLRRAVQIMTRQAARWIDGEDGRRLGTRS